MSYKPFISVVIPTFNRARQVQVALKSVLTQTYPEYEAIVVDDGSTDGTADALTEAIRLQGSNGKRVRYIFQPNQGQSVARNKGIEKACGEWIAFLDSDDVWLPEKLEWQVRAIEHFQGNCRACITDARLVDDFGKDTTVFRESGRYCQETLGMDAEAAGGLVTSREPFWLSTLLVRADVGKQVGWFDPQIGYAEDHDFFFRLSLTTPFCYANKPLTQIDRSKSPQGSICRPWDKAEVRLRGSQSMAEKWLNMGSKLSPDVRKTLVQNLRHVHSAWTNWYLEHGRYPEARLAVSRAVKFGLTPTLAMKWLLTQAVPGFARRISPKMRVYE